MYICGKFNHETLEDLKMWGHCKDIEITPEGKKLFCGISYNADTNKLEVTTGNNIIVASNQIGITEKSIIDIVPLRKGLLAVLLSGYIYIDNGKGVCARLDIEGKGTGVTKPKNVYWLNVDTFKTYIHYSLISEFGLEETDDFDKYINNMVFTCCMENSLVNGASTFSFKCEEFNGGLGVTEFPRQAKDKVVKTESAVYEMQSEELEPYADDYNEEEEYTNLEEEFEDDDAM